MTRRERLHAALAGEPADGFGFVPITMMYAADLIGARYVDYETKAEVQVAGQLAIAERFGAAVISAISDPTVEAHDLGAHVEFPESTPAHVVEGRSLLTDPSALTDLTGRGPIDPASGRRMSNRLEAVRMLRERAGDELVVEGWVEGPCAEAADLRGINRLMMDFYGDPDFLGDLLDFVTEQEIAFSLAQLEAGAELIGIGDAAASLIGPELYADWIAPRTRRYVEAIHAAGGLVRLHICGRTQQLAPTIATYGVDMIDIDFGNDIAAMRADFAAGAADGVGPAIGGNIDPVTELKDGTPELLAGRLTECRTAAGERFLVGAGCEVPRGTPEANLDAMLAFASQDRPPAGAT